MENMYKLPKMISNTIFVVGISVFISSCSTPVHLYGGIKSNKSSLSYIHANTDAISVVSIDGIKTPNSSSIGDQDYYIKPGRHIIVGKALSTLYFVAGHSTSSSRNIKSHCFNTKAGVGYWVITKYDRNNDWKIIVQELDSGKNVDCK